MTTDLFDKRAEMIYKKQSSIIDVLEHKLFFGCSIYQSPYMPENMVWKYKQDAIGKFKRLTSKLELPLHRRIFLRIRCYFVRYCRFINKLRGESE